MFSTMIYSWGLVIPNMTFTKLFNTCHIPHAMYGAGDLQFHKLRPRFGLFLHKLCGPARAKVDECRSSAGAKTRLDVTS